MCSVNSVEKNNRKIEFEHVLGHSGDKHNDQADENLAKLFVDELFGH